MEDNRQYIAVFDSGVGGISVLRHLRREMPGERFLYYGDSANAPYGTRPTEEIRTLTLAAAEKLWAQGAKALVVACNTATSAAIETLRSRWPDRIIVGIEPALKPAADRFAGGTIGIMATPATLREEKFRHLLERFAQTCRVIPIPAPGLVELIEQGLGDSPAAEALLRDLLAPYKDSLDALVLGCTHYPFAANCISRILGSDVPLLDGSEGTARETHRRLAQAGLLEQGNGEVIFENSIPNLQMQSLSQSLLTQPMTHEEDTKNQQAEQTEGRILRDT